MTTTEKRGFRLPWGAETRKPDQDPSAAPRPAAGTVAKATDLAPAISTVEGAALPRAGTLLRRGQVDDLGRGPFDLGPMSASEAAAIADGLVEVDEPGHDQKPAPGAVDDGAAAPAEDPAGSPQSGNQNAAWPDSDRRGSPTHVASDAPPPPRPSLVPGPGRKTNPLVAGLVKAMRDAAKAARDEAMARMRADAAARVDEIRTEALAAAAGLKKQADDDVAAVREWTKAEMARIRHESDARIADRRARLVSETKEHASKTERQTADVKAAIDAFEAEMQRFFDILLAEEDPARLATLAERLPEAPSFTRPVGLGVDSPVRRAARSTRPATTRRRAEPAARKRRPGPRLAADAAAAAEAEAIAGLDDELHALRAALVPAEADMDAPDDARPADETAPAGAVGVKATSAAAEAAAEPAAAVDHAEAAVAGAPEADADSLAAWNEALAALRAAGRDGTDPGDASGAADAVAAETPVTDTTPGVDADLVDETPAAGSLLAVLADAPRINSPDDLSPEERIALLGFDEAAQPDPEPDAVAMPVEDVTRVVVAGLSSVAGISGFKSALTAATGVVAVSVTSGAEGSFVFSVVHTAECDLRALVPGFARFAPQLSADEGAVLTFSVTEPEP